MRKGSLILLPPFVIVVSTAHIGSLNTPLFAYQTLSLSLEIKFLSSILFWSTEKHFKEEFWREAERRVMF